MKRTFMMLALTALMVVALSLSALSAFAAGNNYARGQDDSNPGFLNDARGDEENDRCNFQSKCSYDNPKFVSSGQFTGTWAN